MRKVVVLILLVAPTLWGQTESEPQTGGVEFYTTQPTGGRAEAVVVYADGQKLGEVRVNQPVRFSGSPGTYRFGLKPNAPAREHVSVSLRSGQQLYLRVTSEGFFLGSSAEAVTPQPEPARSRPASGPTLQPASIPSNPDGSAPKENATIFFYRDRLNSNERVTVYSLFASGNRPIATLQKGEYIAVSVIPGMSAFSWTPAPAKGQILKLDIIPGQQLFLRVHPSGITPIDHASLVNVQDLRAVDSTRIQDKARVLDQPFPTQPTAVAEFADNRSGSDTQLSRRWQPVADQRVPRQEPASAPEPGEPLKTREVRITGYVTAVTSPTAFEIDDYRITHDDDLTMQFDNRGSDVQFNIANIEVGTELDIKGDLDEETQHVRAKTIKVDLEQFRTLQNTAVLTRPPAGLVKSGNGWTGTFFADGQRIRVSPDTKVSLKLSSTETVDNDLLTSLEEVSAGMLMTYEGVRDVETGMILADRVEFARNEFEKGEQDLWNRSLVRFRAADSLSDKPGELTVPGVGKFKLVPNEEVQDYVTRIGKSLVPKYALSIAQTDPSRFRFQFYVVIDDKPNAFALPNGIFVIHSGMFAILENEAQLAALIGHEMAHAMQEHQWRELQARKTLTTGMGVTVAEAFGRMTLRDFDSLTDLAMRNGYAPSQENQADRAGLEYMVNAGYDPREAPRLWTAIARATRFQDKNSFYGTYDNYATRRSYLINQLQDNYSGLNFADLRIEETSFKRMVNLTSEAVSGKAKVQPSIQKENPTLLGVR
jgi:hypothetical protein